MCHVAAPVYNHLPSPPLSPLGFGQNYTIPSSGAPGPFRVPPSPPQSPAPALPRYVPVAPEDRLGSCLAGSLRLDGILGTGAYGVVYSAVDIYTNVRYAVKTLSKFNTDGTPLDQRQMAFQTREIRLHWEASAHQNVVSMLKIIDGTDCIFVILEYCPEGDLFYNITECGQYVGKDDLAKRIFLQILEAVEFCHSRGIYHRDLKPENVLVKDQGETVKLADFGLATSSERSDDYGCGSTFYMSPECLDHSSKRPFYYCAPNDVWSLGVILVNLTCGRNPWKQASIEDSTYRAYARSAGFLKTILPVSDELNDILGSIFTRDPEQRITLPVLKQRILACPRFTCTEQPALPTPPSSPSVQENGIIDAMDYDYPPPAESNDEYSDGDSSDDDSIDGAASDDDSIDGLDNEDRPVCPVEPNVSVPPLAPLASFAPAEPRMMTCGPQFNMYQGVMPEPLQPVQQLHQVPHGNCAPKFGFPQFWDIFRQYAPPPPQIHHSLHFYPQVSFPVPGF
ncbi:kinase-like domain-containing protein [Diaporthe sp. PMI_573]|nr:kinase-like domain-containing protein [Diaporthaceae sp. PMI_573]